MNHADSCSALARFARQLDGLQQQQALRTRRVTTPLGGAQVCVDGEVLLQFCSNDYLGLAQHPALIEAACQSARTHGVGSGGSPMVSGHSAPNAALEQALADFVQLQRSLYFYAGFATNASIIPALLDGGGVVFSDALNHASLIDGCRLSKARIHAYPHQDLGALARLLHMHPSTGTKLIVSDAVFSMDGDVADIPALLALAEAHDALLLLDDAHGFGVRGPQGRGSLAAAGLTGAHAHPRIVYVGTLSKAAGGSGGFVAGDALLIEWLLQRTRSYTFATAAPALLAQAMLASLQQIEHGDTLRARLQENIGTLRARLQGLAEAQGWRLLPSGTSIQSLIIGHNEPALHLMQALRSQGFWVPAIRPPTVPQGTARLRIALSSAHTANDIHRLCDALAMAACTGGVAAMRAG